MFRNVPECSGMFHVPGFIDGHLPITTFAKTSEPTVLFAVCKVKDGGVQRFSKSRIQISSASMANDYLEKIWPARIFFFFFFFFFTARFLR